jgi:hypothetical protein
VSGNSLGSKAFPIVLRLQQIHGVGRFRDASMGVRHIPGIGKREMLFLRCWAAQLPRPYSKFSPLK